MDYNSINIYTKEKFTLESRARGKQFRFIRYNGHNYDEVKAYIKEFSPNTNVWEERQLKVGVLYGYSGRTAQFLPTIEFDIRCIIASNPLLLTEDGAEIPLSMSCNEASEYLYQNHNNKVFCYEDILTTFTYNPDKHVFLAFDQHHPKGVECSELPQGKEWFIGSHDNIHKTPFTLEAVYQHSLHIVDIRFKFDNDVEKIEKLKYQINKTLNIRKQKIMFAPTWENYVRRQKLAFPCLKYAEFQEFVMAIYQVTYEETKVNGFTRQSLGPFQGHMFTKIVGGLRHRYAHGEDGFVSSDVMSIDEIYLRYLKIDNEPQCPDDFLTIQHGILTDCQSFMEEILDSLHKKSTIKDIIQEDDSGNIFCGKALLPNDFGTYKGLNCCILNYVSNEDSQTKDSYPYYCKKPEYIEVNFEGVISVTENNVCHCNGYTLSPSLIEEAGKYIAVTSIQPFLNAKEHYFHGRVVRFDILKNTKPLKNDVVKAKSTINNNDVPKLTEEEIIVEVDDKGRTHFKNILIGKKRMCKKGDVLIIRKIGNNPAPNAELVETYPFVALELDVVSKCSSSKEKIPPSVSALVDIECVVEEDENSFTHVGEVYIGIKKECKKGDIIIIRKIDKNPNPKWCWKYPYLAMEIDKKE
jgi:hypothetical protein